MAKALHEQLYEAFEAKGLTWSQLIKLAELECSEDSVSRKLRGLQVLYSFEVEKMARALGVKVVAGRTAA